jgi:TRAP-type C4-dicarboxylate transport system substrate-binding protein
MKLLQTTALLSLLALTADARAEERRVATLAPVGSPWMTIMEKGAARLDAATEGRIEIKYYAGGVQGDENDVVRKMRLEQLDGAALTTIGLSKIYSGIRVLQLPLMFDSEEEMAYVRDKMWPYFRKKFKAKGFRLQSPGGAGWEYFYTNRAAKSLKQLRKVKMWAWSSDPVAKELFNQLGLQAVPLGVPDLLGALKTGRVDGCYGPPLAAVALQWYNEVSHASKLPMSYTIGANVVRYDVWDAASDADKKAEKKVVRKMTKQVNKRTARDNKRALKAMTKAGVKLYEPDAELRKQLIAAAEATWKELAGTVYTKDELDMVLEYRKEFRDKQASR